MARSPTWWMPVLRQLLAAPFGGFHDASSSKKVSGLVLRNVTFEPALQTVVLLAGLRYEILDEKTVFVLK